MESIRTVNAGSFRKGMVPKNKGTHLSSRVDDFAVKGRRGFQRRAVIEILPDGSVGRRWDSVGAATKALNLRDRHSVTNACNGRFFCRGTKLMYEDDWSPLADYHYHRSGMRDIYGRLLPCHHANATMRKMSAAAMEARRQRSRALSARMCRDPDSRWGKGSALIPVRCETDGKEYPVSRLPRRLTGLILPTLAWRSDATGRYTA